MSPKCTHLIMYSSCFEFEIVRSLDNTTFFYNFQFSSISEYYEVVMKVLKEKRPKIICGWSMFFYPSFVVCHPDTAKVLYKSSTPKAVAAGGAYRYIKDWIGDFNFKCF